jgi:glucan phosphoethanolaminetransferase (alkaline phosphatase superfamily)
MCRPPWHDRRASVAGDPRSAARPSSTTTFRRILRSAFVTQFALLDLVTRPALQFGVARLLELAAALSLGLLLSFRDEGRWSRVGRAATAAVYLVVQIRFYRYYHASIDARVLESLLYGWEDVRPVVLRALPEAIAAVLCVTAFEYAWLKGSAGVLELRRPMVATGAAVVLLLSLAAPAGGVTRRFLQRSERVAARIDVPPLPSTRQRLPNVLLIVTESVRASDYCTSRGQSCATSPEIDALLPGRIALSQMRSVGSYTCVSVNALLTGRPPIGSPAQVASTPGLFDFMKAVRAGGLSPTVAYWSAQTDSVFPRRDVRSTIDSFVTVSDLVGHSVADEDEVIDQGVDRLLTAHVEKHIRSLPEPFVLVLHFQGTHAPYFTDDAHAPFKPMRHAVTWSGLEELHNAYLDAIFEQDRSIAASVRSFLDRTGPAPYVIVFTSDHGEAFGEHGAIHHGQNLNEEQIHVPAWFSAGNGALDENQLGALESHRDALVTHLDVLPTLLDVAGVLSGYAMASFRKSFPGRSLVAPREALREPVPLTNCTSLFPCPIETWGILDETHELAAQAWDADFRCTTLAGLPESPAHPACDRLRRASKKWFPAKPNGATNR